MRNLQLIIKEDKLELNEEIKKPNVSDEGTQQISLDL